MGKNIIQILGHIFSLVIQHGNIFDCFPTHWTLLTKFFRMAIFKSTSITTELRVNQLMRQMIVYNGRIVRVVRTYYIFTKIRIPNTISSIYFPASLMQTTDTYWCMLTWKQFHSLVKCPSQTHCFQADTAFDCFKQGIYLYYILKWKTNDLTQSLISLHYLPAADCHFDQASIAPYFQKQWQISCNLVFLTFSRCSVWSRFRLSCPSSTKLTSSVTEREITTMKMISTVNIIAKYF